MANAEPLLEIDLMRTLVAIGDTGSFAAAARQVFRTPSAVSMQIKRLEEQVGCELFAREGRNLVLTPDGESLLSFGRQMLQVNARALRALRGEELVGAIRFGAPDDFGTRFLPNILTRFASSHPRVEVQVSLGTSSAILEQFDDDELDVALISTVKPKRSQARGRLVFAEPLVWVGAKNGRAVEQQVLPLALAGLDCAWRGSALRALDSQDRSYRIAYTCDNCGGQLAAVSADLAIAPMPASLVTSAIPRLSRRHGLPALDSYEIRLLEKSSPGTCSEAFASHVTDSLAQERQQ